MGLDSPDIDISSKSQRIIRKGKYKQLLLSLSFSHSSSSISDFSSLLFLFIHPNPGPPLSMPPGVGPSSAISAPLGTPLPPLDYCNCKAICKNLHSVVCSVQSLPKTAVGLMDKSLKN